MVEGIVFDIKEAAVHDGPGLRQTVFLKGCPLRCQWCHNPEGQSMFPQLMVAQNACTRCGRCLAVCSRQDCIACGACVSCCPGRLRRVVGRRYSAAELAKALMADAEYYAAAGGGVTFSGGEPLLQPAFVLETAALLGPHVHKAVETSGHADAAVFGAFMEAFDLVLLDLKQMDDALHRRYTGVSNELILRNGRQLCRGDTPFVVRIPVIPGVNDNAAHFRAVSELVRDAPALERVELLPYHLTAGAKYAMIGKTYQPDFDPTLPPRIDQSVFSQCGIRSCVL